MILSGVYLISCAANGRYYAGSSANIRQRIKKHFSTLRGGTHHNRKMQRAWDKYGEASFGWAIVEITEQRLEREQFWIDQCDRKYSAFNILPFAFSSLGRPCSVETRAKLSRANLGKKLSAETCAKMSAARLGKPLSAEHRAKMAAVPNRGFLGGKHSNEARVKISLASLAMWRKRRAA